MKQDQIEKHSTTQSVILHLLPGILVGCFYFLARQPVAKMGYPSIFALHTCIRLYSYSGRTRISVISGKEKDRPLYITGDHQLSKFNPVVAILCMGNNYFCCYWCHIYFVKTR